MKALTLAKAVEFYLQQRRQLGFGLKEEGQILAQLVAYAAERGHRGPLTIELALSWAQAPAQASRLWWARRLDAARRFAAFWRVFDPRTELPPVGILGPSYRRRAVHIYTQEQIEALMQAADCLGGSRGLTYRTLIGLLACTGLRVGEALRLKQKAIDWTAGLLQVRHSKSGRSRSLPLQPCTLNALGHYRRNRPPCSSATQTGFFFLGQNGCALSYSQVAHTFECLRQQLGWKLSPVPRLHDLRHTFAVRRLIDWYGQGDDLAQKVLFLATYLGHSSINHTYWYLSAVPELLSLTHARWTQWVEGGSHA